MIAGSLLGAGFACTFCESRADASAYHGMLRDAYLDDEVLPDLTAVWTKRLVDLPSSHFGYLAAIDGRPVGFAFARGNHDPIWGTLLDNIHVLPAMRGQGLGRCLVAALCRDAQAYVPDAGIYLWVFEQNTPARRFYEQLGGECAERVVMAAPDGGVLAQWRMTWPDPTYLRAAAERNSGILM